MYSHILPYRQEALHLYTLCHKGIISMLNIYKYVHICIHARHNKHIGIASATLTIESNEATK